MGSGHGYDRRCLRLDVWRGRERGEAGRKEGGKGGGRGRKGGLPLKDLPISQDSGKFFIMALDSLILCFGEILNIFTLLYLDPKVQQH